jgi:flagellar basal-body rod protein FlgB
MLVLTENDIGFILSCEARGPNILFEQAPWRLERTTSISRSPAGFSGIFERFFAVEIPAVSESGHPRPCNSIRLLPSTMASGVHFPWSMLDPVSNSLEKYMDVLTTRQKFVASNIANADTPGYKTQDIDFQAEFRNALQGGGAPRAVPVTGLRTQNDGNNVNLDRESRLLSETALRFSTASSLMHDRFRILREAIHEGQGS